MATTFNAKYVTLGVEPLTVDDFGEGNENIIGLAHSAKAISIHQLKRLSAVMPNYRGLYNQHFFHIWELMSFSPFETLICFEAGNADQVKKTMEDLQAARRKVLIANAEKQAKVMAGLGNVVGGEKLATSRKEKKID